MDADDEMPSHPSPDTDSPSPPHHDNGRISVTVAAVAQPSPHPSHDSLTLALPIQHPRTTTTITATTTAGGSSGGGGGGGGGGREDCWSEGATSVLIDAWGERYLELSRGNLKQKHWREVADIVSSREDYSKPPKSDIQCKNRIDTVKKKYKIEKAKIGGGGPPSRWPFFERLERLLGPTLTGKTQTQTPSAAPVRPSSSASSSQKIPVGIPVVGVRPVTVDHYSQHNQPFSSPPPSLNPRFAGGYNNSTIKQQQPFRKRLPMVVDSDSEPDDPSPDSTDSLPPETYMRTKIPRVEFNRFNSALSRVERAGGNGGNDGGLGEGGGGGGKEKEKGWGDSVRELTNAILKFGEAYEKAESAKLQQMVEMEKQRMKFAKELELQRMKFLMKTQLELSQLSRSSSRRFGENKNHQNNNDSVANNSDSSN